MKFWPCILPANSPHSTRDLCPEYIGCFQRSLGPNGWGNVTLGGRIFNSVFRCLGANVINKGRNWGNSGLGIGETPPLQTVANSINRTNGRTVMLRAEERRCCMDWRDNVLLYVRVWMQWEMPDWMWDAGLDVKWKYPSDDRQTDKKTDFRLVDSTPL